jgi:hypothetical protein
MSMNRICAIDSAGKKWWSEVMSIKDSCANRKSLIVSDKAFYPSDNILNPLSYARTIIFLPLAYQITMIPDSVRGFYAVSKDGLCSYSANGKTFGNANSLALGSNVRPALSASYYAGYMFVAHRSVADSSTEKRVLSYRALSVTTGSAGSFTPTGGNSPVGLTEKAVFLKTPDCLGQRFDKLSRFAPIMTCYSSSGIPSSKVVLDSPSAESPRDSSSQYIIGSPWKNPYDNIVYHVMDFTDSYGGPGIKKDGANRLTGFEGFSDITGMMFASASVFSVVSRSRGVYYTSNGGSSVTAGTAIVNGNRCATGYYNGAFRFVVMPGSRNEGAYADQSKAPFNSLTNNGTDVYLASTIPTGFAKITRAADLAMDCDDIRWGDVDDSSVAKSGRFVAVGRTAANKSILIWSDDGQTWTKCSVGSGVEDHEYVSIVYV